MGAADILVVEDDQAIWRGLSGAFAGQGYTCDWAASGPEAMDKVSAATALVLLDLGLPGMDGIEVCRRIRLAHPTIQIMILTARAEEVDTVVGLDAGADDYITKPFRLAELMARVRARLRHLELSRSEVVRAGPVEVDLGARRVHVGDVEVALRPKEFDLLALLCVEAPRVLTRERLMDQVWDDRWAESTKTLDIHVSSVRKKLEEAGAPDRITTIRGVGYRLETG
jgi:DNA-binding response OmpR family regulator